MPLPKGLEIANFMETVIDCSMGEVCESCPHTYCPVKGRGEGIFYGRGEHRKGA